MFNCLVYPIHIPLKQKRHNATKKTKKRTNKYHNIDMINVYLLVFK